MGSGSFTCLGTRPNCIRLSTSGLFWMSRWSTAISRPSPISSKRSSSAVAFSIPINSNQGQTSTGGPSQACRPNQPEIVSVQHYSVVREVGIRLRDTGAVGSCVELNALRCSGALVQRGGLRRPWLLGDGQPRPALSPSHALQTSLKPAQARQGTVPHPKLATI